MFAVKGGGIYSVFSENVRILKQRGIDVKINSSEKCDLLHAHSLGPKFLRMSKLYRNRCVASAHTVAETIPGRFAFPWLWLPFFKLYLRFAYNQATVVIAVSPLVRENLLRLGVKSEIIFLPNGINRERFKRDEILGKKFRDKYGIKEDDFVALCSGQILPAKGVETFCRAAKKLPDIRFVWIGGRPLGVLSSEFVKVSQMVKSAGPNVVFTGDIPYENREELVGAYSAANLFFFPSFQENFSMSILEAASVGLPLLLRDNKEYADVYQGNYLKAKNDQEFAELVMKLKRDQEFYDLYSKKAEEIAKTYDIQKITDDLLKIYERLIR
jgi:1,2-diacylglycerol-3-alpha-glucose alpha-1,2-galactosyltransferase